MANAPFGLFGGTGLPTFRPTGMSGMSRMAPMASMGAMENDRPPVPTPTSNPPPTGDSSYVDAPSPPPPTGWWNQVPWMNIKSFGPFHWANVPPGFRPTWGPGASDTPTPTPTPTPTSHPFQYPQYSQRWAFRNSPDIFGSMR